MKSLSFSFSASFLALGCPSAAWIYVEEMMVALATMRPEGRA